MKGKIDVTVDCKVRDQPSHVVPLELKTGRPSYSAEHKGQVSKTLIGCITAALQSADFFSVEYSKSSLYSSGQ